MKYILSLMIAVVCLTSANSQVAVGNVPSRVINAFQSKYPHASNVYWTGKVVHFSVNFNSGGENLTANYKDDGTWEQTYMGMPFNNLPSAIKNGFDRSKYKDWKVKEVRRIDARDKDRVYRIEVKKNTFQKKNLFFNVNGQLTDDNITV